MPRRVGAERETTATREGSNPVEPTLADADNDPKEGRETTEKGDQPCRTGPAELTELTCPESREQTENQGRRNGS